MTQSFAISKETLFVNLTYIPKRHNEAKQKGQIETTAPLQKSHYTQMKSKSM
jgi:hypothetical protein